MKLLLGIVATIGILSAPTYAAKLEGKAPKVPSSNYKLVMEVKSVTLKVIKVGGSIKITATGIVPTGGWTQPELSPYIYITPPADGIYSFDFIAKAPSGMANQILTPITVTLDWPNYPAGLKGIRVIAAKNQIVKPLIAKKAK